jgi:integrase/recombinase XerC
MVIEQFCNYLRYERNKSPLTVQNYASDLRAFEAYLAGLDEHQTLLSADSDLIRGWMESMMDKGNAATSVARRLSAVRMFFRYAVRKGLVAKNPTQVVSRPKTEKPLPQFLKEDEVDRLVDWKETDGEPSYKEVRAHAIITVFYETGMRLSELTGLDDDSVDFTMCMVKVRGKGNKQRVIPFGKELSDVLEHYMTVRDANVVRTDHALFVTAKGCRMNSDQVRYEVRKHVAMVSTLKKRSPHVLRHTFATAMLNHGAGIESIKKLLGHESVKTTEIYAHTTFEQLKRVYKQAHPRA